MSEETTIKVGNVYLEIETGYCYMVDNVNSKKVTIRYLDDFDDYCEMNIQSLLNVLSRGEDKLVSEI
jgi:hypothetical protein